MKRALSIGIIAGLCHLVCLAPPAVAKSTKRLDYRFNTIWSTTVRLLRVDQRYAIKEKDKENGFILFLFPGSGSVKRCPASLEFIHVQSPGARRQVQLQLNIAHQPSYVEMQLLDRIERKLRREQGPPPKQPPKRDPPTKKPSPPSDKGPRAANIQSGDQIVGPSMRQES